STSPTPRPPPATPFPYTTLFRSFHDANGGFPAAAIQDNKGKAMLSWRVAILPYVEEAPLYRQFKLDEPWDSKHNKKLLAKMPKRSEEHTSELQSPCNLVCRLLLE